MSSTLVRGQEEENPPINSFSATASASVSRTGRPFTTREVMPAREFLAYEADPSTAALCRSLISFSSLVSLLPPSLSLHPLYLHLSLHPPFLSSPSIPLPPSSPLPPPLPLPSPTLVLLWLRVLCLGFGHDPPLHGQVPPAVHQIRAELGVRSNDPSATVHHPMYQGWRGKQNALLLVNCLDVCVSG